MEGQVRQILKVASRAGIFTHRAAYRWTVQAFAVPVLVAFLCERVSDRNGRSESSKNLSSDQLDAIDTEKV